jgi:acyl carrier protein
MAILMTPSIHEATAFAQLFDRLTAMEDGASIEAAVRDLVRSRSALARDRADLPGELPLGPGGLGLDSIALVELLLDCQRRFGIPRPAELLEGPPLTLGLLVDHIRAELGQ